MTPEAEALRGKFAEALLEYRAGQFDLALALFGAMADRDPVSAAFADRLKHWGRAGPTGPWNGVTNLELK